MLLVYLFWYYIALFVGGVILEGTVIMVVIIAGLFALGLFDFKKSEENE